MSERLRRLLEICETALAKGAEERAAFIERECSGDQALREEVEAVLAGEARAKEFLATPLAAGFERDFGAGDVQGMRELLRFPPAGDITDAREQSRAPLAGEPFAPDASVGSYRIVREIGRGGMGVVFEAIQEPLGRRVALKILPGLFALDPRRRDRFLREARATAGIRHPNIVPVHEVGEAGGVHYYSMEYIDGPELAEVLARAREEWRSGTDDKAAWRPDATTIARRVAEAAAVADGLDLAHQRGFTHRDVKPSNILIDPGGHWVLADFGLVHEADAQTITRSGEVLGTLAYMAPEQIARGAGEVDGRTDVYALAATLYEAVTLERPFNGKSDHELESAILAGQPVPPRQRNPRLHRDLETILLRALDPRPRAAAPPRALRGGESHRAHPRRAEKEGRERPGAQPDPRGGPPAQRPARGGARRPRGRRAPPRRHGRRPEARRGVPPGAPSPARHAGLDRGGALPEGTGSPRAARCRMALLQGDERALGRASLDRARLRRLRLGGGTERLRLRRR